MRRYRKTSGRNSFRRGFSFFPSWFCLVILLTSGSVTHAHDSREHEARGLYVEAARILRGAGCQQFKPLFTFGGAFNPFAQLFMTAEKRKSLEKCFITYEAAARIYDQILLTFSKTETAVLIEKEGRLDSKSLAIVRNSYFPEKSSPQTETKPPPLEDLKKLLEGLNAPLEPQEKNGQQ
jgi:hypothetical protein